MLSHNLSVMRHDNQRDIDMNTEQERNENANSEQLMSGRVDAVVMYCGSA